MKSNKCLTMLIVTVILTACATKQTYEGKELPTEQVALIKSRDQAGASAILYEVDGKAIGLAATKATVKPGEHRIMFRVNTGIVRVYSAYVSLTMYAEAGHTYQLDGKIHKGDNVYAWITDENTNKIVAGKKYGEDASSYAYSEDKIIITKNNNVINMPNYSIEVPPDQGWSLDVIDREHSKINLRKSIDSTAYLMWFNINWVASEHMKTWTAKQVADDYRKGELSDMQMQGVMTGMAKLKDVVMGEEIVGDKKFYTMDYVFIRDDLTQISSVYLFFPKETDIGVFIVAIYTDGYTGKEMMSRSYKPEFIRVLESLQVTKDVLTK